MGNLSNTLKNIDPIKYLDFNISGAIQGNGSVDLSSDKNVYRNGNRATLNVATDFGGSGGREIWQSPEFDWPENTTKTFYHELGVTPVNAWLGAKCISAEHGYQVGDWAFGLCWYDYYRTGPFSVRVNNTIIGGAFGDYRLSVIDFATGGGADYEWLTTSKWKFSFFAMI